MRVTKNYDDTELLKNHALAAGKAVCGMQEQSCCKPSQPHIRALYESRHCMEQYSYFSPKETALLYLTTRHYSDFRNKISNNNKLKMWITT